MTPPARPSSRENFHIAIICALPRESDAITLLFDHFWDDNGDPFGRALGDMNTYTTGSIGNHNVVLAVLPNMGTTSAASAAANLRSSYSSLKLALIVGICGGTPKIAGHDAFLGDVVVSKTIIQYDYGRQYPGQFDMKKAVEDSLGRANKDIRSLIASFETQRGKKLLRTKTTALLRRLQNAAVHEQYQVDYQYPGFANDKLFLPHYIHRHRHRTSCNRCSNESAGFCESASKAHCSDVGCDEHNLVSREPRLEKGGYTPAIFLGRIGSSNTVMKSGEDRDRIAAEHELIAFEMEGAGAWDEVPCIIVKGICDYADSHKNKKWQDFAAATAASVARAILERFVVDGTSSSAPAHKRGEWETGGSRSISHSSIGNGAFVNQGTIRGNVTF